MRITSALGRHWWAIGSCKMNILQHNWWKPKCGVAHLTVYDLVYVICFRHSITLNYIIIDFLFIYIYIYIFLIYAFSKGFKVKLNLILYHDCTSNTTGRWTFGNLVTFKGRYTPGTTCCTCCGPDTSGWDTFQWWAHAPPGTPLDGRTIWLDHSSFSYQHGHTDRI